MAVAATNEGARVDWSHLMEQFEGNLTVVCEIVEAYALETRGNLDQLPDRLAQGDASEVRRQAHTLGGTMRMFGVQAAEATARQLEDLAAGGTLDGAAELVDALVEVANRVLPQLERFVETGGASGSAG